MNKEGFFGKLIILGFILVFFLGVYFTIQVLSDFSVSDKESIRNSPPNIISDNNIMNNTNSTNSSLTNSTSNYKIVDDSP